MSRNGPSYYIESVGPQETALVQGFEWLVAQAAKSGTQGLAAVSQKANLDNIAHWSGLRPILWELRERGETSVEGVVLYLFTAKDGTVSRWDGPILAIYGGQKLLDAVDGITGVASVLYVPWQPDDYLDWVATWGAAKYGGAVAKALGQAEPTSGIVQFALRDLTASVNVGTGITNPSDYERAVVTLETLYHKGAQAAPEDIRRQLVRLGWDPADAAKVKTLAEKISTGRRPKKSTGHAEESLWTSWNARCREGSET